MIGTTDEFPVSGRERSQRVGKPSFCGCVVPSEFHEFPVVLQEIVPKLRGHSDDKFGDFPCLLQQFVPKQFWGCAASLFLSKQAASLVNAFRQGSVLWISCCLTEACLYHRWWNGSVKILVRPQPRWLFAPSARCWCCPDV